MHTSLLFLSLAACVSLHSQAATPTNGTPLTQATFASSMVTKATDDSAVSTELLPYQQSFDNERGDYDGTSYLPRGWVSYGTQPFVTAAMNTLPAATGTYYMATGESESLRDESVYTPFFDMEAGKTYEISFQLYMPGDFTEGLPHLTTLTLSATTAQDDAAEATTLLQVDSPTPTAWTPTTATFTPTQSGTYCFCMRISSTQSLAGEVAIDDFGVTYKDAIMMPTADFTIDGTYDMFNGNTLRFTGYPTHFANLSTEATAYEWHAEGAEPSTSTEANPSFVFPADGTYTVSLTARNARGESTVSHDYLFASPTVDNQTALWTIDQLKDEMLYKAAQIPKFDTDAAYDFISGFNHYYTRYAERYDMPEGLKMSISGISSWMAAYSRMMAATSAERNHPFYLTVYGETDGKLDESKVYGRVSSTVVDMFGDIGVDVMNPKMIMLDLSSGNIQTQGPFYVAFEWAANMPMDSQDKYYTRSYFALGMTKHHSGKSSIYVYPTKVPAGSTQATNEWCNLTDLDSELTAYGLNLVLWCTIDAVSNGIVAINADGQVCFATRLDGSQLTVSGTRKGDSLRIYDAGGRLMQQTACTDAATQLSVTSLPKGTYIVTVNGQTSKFVK